MRCPWAVAFLAWVACAPPRVDFREVTRAYRSDEYEGVHRRWTRSSELYERFSQALTMTATLKSWEWRQAYVARYAERYALSATERQALLARQKAEHEDAIEIVLHVAILERPWRDLSRAGAPWHLALLNDRGQEVHPRRIERLRKVAPDVSIFFPEHGPFDEVYVVRFPRKLPDGSDFLGASPRRLTLRLAGAPGKTEVAWVQASSR